MPKPQQKAQQKAEALWNINQIVFAVTVIVVALDRSIYIYMSSLFSTRRLAYRRSFHYY